MTTLFQDVPARTHERLTLRTCVVCGAIDQPGACVTGCEEALLELAPAGDCDRLATLRCRARAASEAFRAAALALTDPEPAPDNCEAAYRSVQQQARTALRRFPRMTEDAGSAVAVEPAWMCADCGGVDAPKPCLEMCIWMPVDWVEGRVYRRERERALAQQTIESRWRALLRRLISVTPREGQAVRCWRAFRAEAQAMLGAADAVALADRRSGGPKEVNDVNTQDRAGAPDATAVADAPSERGAAAYERGVLDGREWAGGYATAAELREIVGDFTGEGDPHWLGFVAGAEEILAEREVVLNQPRS